MRERTRRRAIFVLIAMLGSLLAGPFAEEVVAVGPFSGGSGTGPDPYQISNCADLRAIDDTATYLSKSFVVTTDLDCSASSFTPLVNGSTYFSGVLEGANNTISGLTISCSTNNCGLFTILNGGTVKNLSFTTPSVTSSAKNIGLIAGSGTGSLLIDNIAVNGGNVTSTYSASATTHTDESPTGGILGEYVSGTGTISDITSSTVVAGKSATGGIVGKSSTGGLLSVTDVVVTGNVSGLRSVGGVVGTHYNAVANGLTITRATVTAASVSGLGQSIGGILGYGWNITIANSFSSADVSGKASGTSVGVSVGHGQGAYVGGIAGQISGGDSTIRDSGSTGDVLGDGVDGSVVADGVAGILGYARLTNFYVTRSYHRGTVTGARGVGGVAGMHGSSTFVTDSYFRSEINVTDTSTSMVGGINGQNSGSMSITRSYFAGTQPGLTAANRAAISKYDNFADITCSSFFFDKEVLGSDKTSLTTGRCGGNGGPAALTTSAMKTVSTFTSASWNFTAGTGVWSINSLINDGYPYLANTGGQDTIAPTASWTVPSSPTASRTLSYTLTFSESVSGIAAGDFSNTGTATGCVFTPSAASASPSITVSVVCSSDGTVIARLASNAVTDLSLNNGPVSAEVATTILINSAVPDATWTAPSTPSASRTLSYTLTFTEPVSGIAAGDFSNTGTATGCVFTPSAAASAAITVSVVCSSDGTVIARLSPNSVINSASTTGPTAARSASSVTIDTVVSAPTSAPTSVPSSTPTSAPNSVPSSASPTNTTSPNPTVASPAGGTTAPGSNSPAAPSSGGLSSSSTTTVKPNSSVTSSTAPVAASGASKVIATTTTEPVTTSTVAALSELELPEIQVGEAAALYRGRKVSAAITRENNELVVKVGPIAARIWALTASGGKVPLDEEGRLRLNSSDSVTVDIEGFDARSMIEVRLYSDPLLLGRTVIDESGQLSASYEIPENVEDGDHRVVLAGVADGDPLTFALSVVVGDDGNSTGIAVWIAVPLALAILTALVLPVAIRRRRRRED